MESYIPEAFRSRLASRKAAIAFLRAINTDVSAWIIDFERSIDLLAVSEVIIGGRQDEL